MLLEQDEKHAIQIQRLATRLYKEQVFKSLERAYRAARLILLEYDAIDTKRVMNQVSTAVSQSISPILDEAWQAVTDELTDFAVYESGFYAALLTKASQEVFKEPAEDKVKRYVANALMSLEGNRPRVGTWAEFIKEQEQSVAITYQNIIKQAFVNGTTTREAAEQLKQATDGLLAREAEALTRTGVQHYALQARESMFSENERLIEWYVYHAVLDNRTTTLCAGRDGNKYKKADRPPLPAHFNCRSNYLPLVKGQDSLEGERNALGGEKGKEAKEAYERRKERKRTSGKVKYRGRRDSDIFDPKDIKATTTYEQFLRRQPMWFIESTLGKARAKLFVDGKLPISKFNDMTGRKLTLDELRRVDAEAFERAGI